MSTAKVVINVCYGGFNLSQEALNRLDMDEDFDDINRADPDLVRVVEELGERANGHCADLKVVEIPAELAKYHTIKEYDGLEHLGKYDLFSWVLDHLDELTPENVDEWKAQVHRIRDVAEGN